MIKPCFEYKLTKGQFFVFNEKPDFNFISTKQIHSNIVVSELNASDSVEADGIFGDSKNPLNILTADCLPIIIEGVHGHATIHAGWKGVRDEIVVQDEIKKLKPVLAFIGPHICSNCYEVQNDFKAHFKSSQAFKEINGKIFFNLSLEVTSQLKKAYPEIYILNSNQCTFEKESFHSYRKNKTTKRNYNIYFPNGDLV